MITVRLILIINVIALDDKDQLIVISFSSCMESNIKSAVVISTAPISKGCPAELSVIFI